MLYAVVAGLLLGFTPGAPVGTSSSSRRAVLSKGFGGAVLLAAPQLAGAVKATTGLSSQFTGDYDDPSHPDCLRTIKVVGAKMDAAGRKSRNPSAYVTGWDGPVDPNLVRLNDEVEALQKELSEAEEAAKVAAEAAAKMVAPDEGAEEAVKVAAMEADKAAKAKLAETAKAAEAKVVKLEAAKAARDKASKVKKACVGRPEQAEVWKLTSTVAEDDSTIRIDFSPKGGPKNLLGTAENLDGTVAIVFSDGNRWTKIPNGTPERRPAQLKTMNTGD